MSQAVPAPTAASAAANPAMPRPRPDGFLVLSATICNSRGLHARAAAKFVKLVERFDAEVLVQNRGQEVSGRSIMGLMMLAASPGTTIEMRARGPQAAEALTAIGQLIADKFDEED